jgi:hypothetical protein
MVADKGKEFKEYEEGVRIQNPGARRCQPWSVPRLRGRGEQGDMVTPSPALSTLCIA